MTKIIAKDTTIRTMSKNGIDYICITDIARQKNPVEPKDVVKNWMRVKNTLEYLGLWESLNNPDFIGVEFDPILKEAGSNSFTMSPSRWVELTNAIGIINKLGREGGTYQRHAVYMQYSCRAGGKRLYSSGRGSWSEERRRMSAAREVRAPRFMILRAVVQRLPGPSARRRRAWV